jgi:hypothetical protein
VLGEDSPPIEMRWWLLPDESAWFEQLFTSEFWMKTVPEQGASALKAPRTRGYRVFVDNSGKVQLTDSSQETYGTTIPVRYTEKWDGEIVLGSDSTGGPGWYSTAAAEHGENMDGEMVNECESAEDAASYVCTVSAGHVEDMDECG